MYTNVSFMSVIFLSVPAAKLENELWLVHEKTVRVLTTANRTKTKLLLQSMTLQETFRSLAIVLVALITLQELVAALSDTNRVISPCAPLQPVALGDAITVAVALGGNRTMWYNNSDPALNVLSPCSPNTAPQILAGTQVTVFRPIVDQLSLFQIYNQTLTNVATTFPAAASLLVYTGYNPVTDNETIVSEPRTFSTSAGKVAGLLLVMEFAKGVLLNITWKDDDCNECGNNTLLCLDKNCATSVADCASLNSSNPDACFTRINVAYSGTDKNSLSFKSWMNVQSVTKYALSALYFKADKLLQKGIQSIIDENNQVGTGGQV